jgi:predicted ester cyclase
MRTLIRLSIFLLVVVIASLPLVVSAHDENSERSHDLAAQFFEAFNQNDIDGLRTIMSDDFVDHQPGVDYGLEETIAGLGILKGAMPDLHLIPQLIIADGDWAAARTLFTGTFTNPMETPGGSLPPTNALVQTPVHFIMHINEDGKIDEVWEAYDNLDYLAQVGAIPMPEGMEMPAMEPIPDDAPMWEVMEMNEESMETARANVTRVIDEFFNAGNADVVSGLFSEDYVVHPDETGRDQFIQDVTEFRAAMPDFVATADPIIVDGNWIAFRFMSSGTFTNPLGDGDGALPPTSQPFLLDGIIIGRLDENGQLIEEWDAFDNLSIGMQLGVIPPMGA